MTTYRSPIAITIPYTEHIKTPDEYTQYDLYVCYRDERAPSNDASWFVLKRFRQMHELNSELKSEGLVSPIIGFPNKTIFGNRYDPALIEKRKIQLEQYFQYLCTQKSIVENAALRDFLEIDIHVNINNDYMAPTVMTQSARMPTTPALTPQRLSQFRTNGFISAGNNTFQLSNEYYPIFMDSGNSSIYANVFKQVTVHGQHTFAQLGLFPLYAYQSLTEPLYVEGYEQTNLGWQKIGYIPLPMTRNIGLAPPVPTKTTVTRLIPVSQVLPAPKNTPQTTSTGTTSNTVTSIKISVSGYGYPYYY